MSIVYTIDRLCESSLILEPVYQTNAIKAFSHDTTFPAQITRLPNGQCTDINHAINSLFDSHDLPSNVMSLSHRLNLIRRIAMTIWYAPKDPDYTIESVISDVQKLFKTIGVITDSFGTNGHYCLSLLHFTESLIIALTGPHIAGLYAQD